MDITDYYNLVSSEEKARRYLSKKCLKNGRRVCPRCGGKKLYRLKENRRRCAACRYTFHDFSGRWINQSQLSAIQWLSIVKLFELEVSPRQISEQLRLNYKTVTRALHVIRQAIAAPEIPRACSVFAVDEIGGRAAVYELSDLPAPGLPRLPVKLFRTGNILYSTSFDAYSGLLSHIEHLSDGDDVDGCKLNASACFEFQGFMNWAGEKFKQHRRISARQFPYFLRELEFRYNHKNGDFFETITGALCNLVPEST